MRRHWWVWGIVAFFSTAVFAQTNGPLGDPANWHLRGLTELSPELVKKYLSRDFEILLVSHPRGPRGALPEVLETRALELFRANGFPEAKVTARIDGTSRQIEILVDEGPRCVANNIVVEGADDELAKKIQARLSQQATRQSSVESDAEVRTEMLQWNFPKAESSKEEDKSLWHKGEPISWGRNAMERIRTRVERVIAENGYLTPKFECQIEPEGGIADLVIHVSDLGARAMIQEIRVDGNQRDSTEQLLRYLNVKQGDPIAEQQRVQMEQALWESGRFEKYKILVQPDDDGVTLVISVKDAKGIPGLFEPLSREQKTVLKAVDWMLAEEDCLRDLVVNYETTTWKGEFVLSQKGTLVDIARQTSGSDEEFHVTAFAADHGIQFYDVTTQRKLAIPDFSTDVTVQLMCGLDWSDPEAPFRTVFGLGFEHTPAASLQSDVPVSFDVTIEPVFLLTLLEMRAAAVKWDDDRLQISTSNGGLLVIHEQSGEFVYRYQKGDDQTHVRAAENYFDDRFQQFVEETDSYDECFDASAPVNSVARFVRGLSRPHELSEVASVDFFEIVDKLCSDEVLRIMDEWVVQARDMSKQREGEQLVFESSLPQENFTQVIARNLVGQADELFPRNSWCWSVFREINFQLAGSGNVTNQELRFVLQNQNTGPVACWAVSELLLVARQPRLAVAVAQMGRQRMNSIAFRTDCEALFGKQLYRLLPVFGSFSRLDATQRQAVAEMLSMNPDLLESMANLFSQLVPVRAADGEQTADSTLDRMEQLWETQLERMVGVRLSAISSVGAQFIR